MRRLLVSAVCLVAFGPFAAAQTADVFQGVPTPDKPEPFGDPAAGRPLPKGAVARLGSPRLRSRTDNPRGLQFSPDGRRIILAAGGTDLWWFDAAGGRTQFRHEYPFRDITCGRLLDDGHLVLFHYREKNNKREYYVTRFDPAAAKLVSDVKVPDVGQSVDGAAFDPRAAAVAITQDRTLTVYDTATGDRRWTRAVNPKPNNTPTFTPDGSKLIVGTPDHLAVHDATDGRPLATLQATAHGRNESPTVAASRDGKSVAAAVPSDVVAVWDAATGKLLHRLPRQSGVLGFAGGRLVTTSADAGSIWDAAGKLECEFPLPTPDKAYLSADGTRLVVTVHDAVVLYDVPAKGPPTLARQSADLPGLPDELHFDPDGALVGRLPAWGGWAVWRTAHSPTELIRPPGPGLPLALSADRRRALRFHDNQYSLAAFDGTPPVLFKHTLSISDTKWAATLSADGSTVVAAADHGLTRYDAAADRFHEARSPYKDRGAGPMTALSADGRVAAAEGYDPGTNARYVEVYALPAGRVVRTVPVRGHVERLALTPDGRVLAVAFRSNRRSLIDNNLLVLDADTGRELLRLGPRSTSEPVRFALAPDGRTAAWGEGNELQVYELASGRARAKLPTAGDLHAIALAGDGRTLAAAAPGWPVVLWDVAGDARLTAPRTRGEWAAAWHDLEQPDAAAAYRAARRMALAPADAAAFLRTALPPAAPPDPAAVTKCLADLDAPAFADREAAAKELRGLGELAVPDLRRVLDATSSAEVRHRVEKLLEQADKPTLAAVRAVRAVEALERLATPDAKAVLKALAAGADGARQTREARAALSRMSAP